MQIAHTTAAATLAGQSAQGAQPNTAAQTTGTDGIPQSVKDSARDFEAVFLSEMLGHMFEGSEPDKMFGGGSGEKMFQGMMVQEYGKMMAKGQGIGIAAQLQRVMLQMQEKHQAVAA